MRKTVFAIAWFIGLTVLAGCAPAQLELEPAGGWTIETCRTDLECHQAGLAAGFNEEDLP